MRLEMLNPPYEGEDAVRVARWVPPNTDVQPTHSVRLMLRQRPDLAEAMRGLAWFLLDAGRSSLDIRLRELAVARTTALAGCEYQWGVHQAVFGSDARITEEQRESTVNGSPDDPCWDARDRTVLRAMDELHETSGISDATWGRLIQHLSAEEIVELITVAGWYLLNSYWTNASQPQLEDFAVPFPRTSSG
jgi:alkylhydroperoxidase family enzyme